MSDEPKHGGSPDQPQGSACPFCGASWSARMVDAFERMRLPGGCACCAPGIPASRFEPDIHEPLPVADLECDSCGRAIYRAPSSLKA